MLVNTRVFGEIEIDESKIITFCNGIIGFPELKRFTLLYDAEKKDGGIKWLQSLDEPAFALPVMDPLYVKESFNPVVEDELLKSSLGELNPEEILVLVTVTVPKDLQLMSVNLQAPIIINAENKTGCQIIIDNATGEFPVKFMIYDILQEKKERAGE